LHFREFLGLLETCHDKHEGADRPRQVNGGIDLQERREDESSVRRQTREQKEREKPRVEQRKQNGEESEPCRRG
jgi:hypothetical protein